MRERRRARAGAALLAVAVLLPSVLILGAPESAPRFAADGDFREWDAVPPVFDRDETPAGALNLLEIRVASRDRGLFVYALAEGPLFAGPQERIARVFVDADGDHSTGFDLGDLGADLMLEAAGAGGELQAAGLFAFDAARAPDDWHGWQPAGSPALAVNDDKLEATFSGAISPSAAVGVALSGGGTEDVLDPPLATAGALVVRQTAPSQVLVEGERAVTLTEVTLSASGSAATVESVAFAPSGRADFALVESARLRFGDSASVVAIRIDPDALVFSLDPPREVGEGASLRAALEVDLSAGKLLDERAGASFGARVSAVAYAPDGALLVLRPRELLPTAYLAFIASAPVVDGAFGEWRLASALADPVDPEAAGGEDLVGVRAMTSGAAGAFFAETRGPILAGATFAGLPPVVSLPAPAVASSSPPQLQPPAPREEPPPLSADDRLLVYFDADSNPTTGFRPALDVPVGAEFVVEVGGRFSTVASAHLLAFAGRSPFESAWEIRGTLRALASGAALEGEIPPAVFALTGSARLFFQTVAWNGRTGDLSDALQDASLAEGDPDFLLHFRAVTFDPLRGPPPVRPGLTTDVPNGFWVVQLNEAPTAGAIGALKSAGATLFGYVHSNAYLSKMDEATANVVRAMPEVRWLGIYQPAFKFPADPAVWGEGPLSLVALLFERPKGLEAAVLSAGGTLLSATDLSARVLINGSKVDGLAFVPAIQYIELENRRVPLNEIARRYQGVNLTFDRHGLNGSGIAVGVSDSGIDFTHPAFDDTGNSTTGPLFDGRIRAYFRYGGAYGDSDGHGTHTAGSIAGDGDLSNTVNNSTAGASGMFRGVAPAASLVVTEILGTTPPLDDKVFADQEAYGATISSNSWGYVGGNNKGITDYDAGAFLTDQSVLDSNASKSGLQPLTIVFAAGNDGSGADTVGSPGTAKNVISVGASESDRGIDTYADNASSIAGFSSRGPTDDSRIKPDVVAIGTYILSAQSRTSGCTCTYGGWDLSWTGANYAFSSGTSQATPHVAGIAALIQQDFNDTFGRIPSPALVKAAVINGAEDLGYGYEFTTGVTGPMSQGWGRVNVTRSIDGPGGGTILLFDEGPVVGAGDVLVRRFTVESPETPLKATLVWSDQPGNPQDTTTLPELVNDIDLIVRAPNGTYYHGNKFQGAWSRANNTTFDRLNNVENVFAASPATGTWSVEVTGHSIKSGQQRFALAVSGNLSEKSPPSVADAHTVPGAPSNAKFGWNATASGSVNGDAYNDLIVGAPGASGGNGAVYMFFGGPSASFASFNVSLASVTLAGTAAEGLGSSVDASGDFDGDGEDDLLVGAPNGGKAYLFRGSTNWASRSADVIFNGSAANLFGASVRLAPLDDRTGAEAVVGAPLASGGNGTVYLFSGGDAAGTWNASAANRTFAGNASTRLLGTSLSAGDADGDGTLDLAVGAPGDSLVLLAHGGAAASSLSFNATLSGIPGTAFGHAITLEGDFNSDGKSDLLAGAPLAKDGEGAAYAFFGRAPLADDRVLRYYFFDGMESGASNWDEMSGGTITGTGWEITSSDFYGSSASGHSWRDSSGNYANDADTSVAFKNPVNLSAASNPVFTFVYRADLEEGASAYDGFLVKYSTNNGSTWTQLDSTNAQGQYDTTVIDPQGNPSWQSAIAGLYAFTFDRLTWRQVTFNISSLAGNSAVKFRLQFVPDGAVAADGINIDDVAVREVSPSSPNLTVYGAAQGERFGWSVASLGDASGDGPADLAIGAPLASPSSTRGAGAVYVFTGSASLNGTLQAADAAETLYGSSTDANLGWSLTPIAGFNGSSATFVFAGSPGASNGSGGGTVGNASAMIPEFDQAALPAAAAVALVLVARRRRRRGG